MAFFKGPQVQKSADGHKTGKNTEKVNQELIKKWSKTQSKTNQKPIKMHLEKPKKHTFGTPKASKVPFFDMMRVKKCKNGQKLTNP